MPESHAELPQPADCEGARPARGRGSRLAPALRGRQPGPGRTGRRSLMGFLGRLIHRRRLEAQLDAELRDHLERSAADYRRAGLGEAEALRRARLDPGGPEQVKEACPDGRPLVRRRRAHRDGGPCPAERGRRLARPPAAHREPAPGRPWGPPRARRRPLGRPAPRRGSRATAAARSRSTCRSTGAFCWSSGPASSCGASPGWFSTYGTSLLAGRDFDPRDRLGAPPVAIVNEAFARRFLGGKSPHEARGRRAAARRSPALAHSRSRSGSFPTRSGRR